MRKTDLGTLAGRSWSTVAGVLALAVFGPAQDFETARASYVEWLRRPSLYKRNEGRELIAATGDARAFELLRRDYAKPEDPREFVRSLVVAIAVQHLATKDLAGTWTEWREAEDDAADVWLWLNALRLGEQVEPGAWREVATSRRPPALRAAAIVAGAPAAEGLLPTADDLTVFRSLLARRAGRGLEREWLVEAILERFAVGAPDALTEAHRELLREIAMFLGASDRSVRSQLALSRTFARVLGRDDLGPDADIWLALLGDEPRDQIEIRYAQRRAGVVHTFFGIPEHGRNVCYLIDASDSMLEPLTARERAELMPLTGKPAAAAGGGEGGARPRDRASDRAELAIDWDRVKSRFDAARELLKTALRTLPGDRTFCVVLFGSRAEPLAATPRLMRVDSKTVSAACAELDAIVPGPIGEDRPQGTLRGDTNVHGAFLAAMRTTTRRPVEDDPHVDPTAFERGCDTIFLLSDGVPSWDDFEAVDVNEDGLAGDPEAGTSYEYDGELVWYGPFVHEHYILADLRRLNLLRRCAIHTVGLGEADYGFLERIARVGHGRTLRIGVSSR